MISDKSILTLFSFFFLFYLFHCLSIWKAITACSRLVISQSVKYPNKNLSRKTMQMEKQSKAFPVLKHMVCFPFIRNLSIHVFLGSLSFFVQSV